MIKKEISDVQVTNNRKKVVIEIGNQSFGITQESVDFIKMVELEAFPKEMITLQWCQNPAQLAYANRSNEKDLICGRGEDWYCLLSQSNETIWICDIASLPTRNVLESRKEIAEFIDKYVINLAANLNRHVLIEAREDTSYKMILRIVNQGKLKILTDREFFWTGNNIKMHFMELKPTVKNIEHDHCVTDDLDNIAKR